MNRKILMPLIIAILVLGLVLAYSRKKTPPPESSVQEQPASSTETTASAGDVICHDGPNYFIASRSAADSMGTDFLVTYKADANQQIPCAYNVSNGDFQISDAQATYFLGLTDNFLVLDSGTAPEPRGLTVYDLNRREKIYTDRYASPIAIQSGTITYWSPTAEQATDENCPMRAEYLPEGLGVEIETYVTLSLSTLAKKETGEYRCSPVQ